MSTETFRSTNAESYKRAQRGKTIPLDKILRINELYWSSEQLSMGQVIKQSGSSPSVVERAIIKDKNEWLNFKQANKGE